MSSLPRHWTSATNASDQQSCRIIYDISRLFHLLSLHILACPSVMDGVLPLAIYPFEYAVDILRVSGFPTSALLTRRQTRHCACVFDGTNWC